MVVKDQTTNFSFVYILIYSLLFHKIKFSFIPCECCLWRRFLILRLDEHITRQVTPERVNFFLLRRFLRFELGSPIRGIIHDPVVFNAFIHLSCCPPLISLENPSLSPGAPRPLPGEQRQQRQTASLSCKTSLCR